MKAFLSCCVLMVIASLNSSGQTASEPPMELYLLIGQSNMAGRGVPEKVDTTADPMVYVFTKDKQWELARDPLHFDKPAIVGTGPGLAFGKAMAAQSKHRVRIGLIPCAQGGSSIDVWQPGAYYDATGVYPYDFTLERVRAAMKNSVLKGICWHQGESDSSPEKATEYLPKLVALVERLRKDLDMPELPFVAAELGYYQENYRHLNDSINQLPKLVSNTAVVSARKLAPKEDNIHFTAASARELGKRFAKAMKKLVN